MNKHLFGPAGGIRYHLAALRYRKTLWGPFCGKVNSWLAEWKTTSTELVVFGPSAGWTLPEKFIARFNRVVAIEPDPVARFLFKWRFSGCAKIEFVDADQVRLPWQNANVNKAHGFESFIASHEGAAILFSNLLGQVPLLLEKPLSPEQQSQARQIFLNSLAGREWASYHDVFSSRARPRELPAVILPLGKNQSEIATPRQAERIYSSHNSICDHDTLWLSEDHETQLFEWRIRPLMNHVIGFVKS
jgi:hypothetical protein